VALGSDGDAYQYEDVTVVEGSAVNSDLVFTANHSHLYVMTTNKVRDCQLFMPQLTVFMWKIRNICH